MNPDRWRLIQELFARAVDLPAARWPEVLRASGADQEVVAEVLELLAADEDAAHDGSVLGRDISDVATRLIDTPAAPPPDIGPYHLLDVLGEGGMGTVFRAERSDTKGVVAIKILRDARLSPARRVRFQREQRLLAQLRHPGIAPIYDAGSLPDGTPFFAMELVEGVSITQYCREHGTPIDERLRLFRAVCEAVQYAHQQAVIHRDLKPSNILVTREGRVKLLDFGISKRVKETLAGPSDDETRDGLRLMTPAYAAPEQLRSGHTAVDTDVYSLGVVLYELLAEGPPFDLDDHTPSEVVDIVLAGDVERPSAAWRERRRTARPRAASGPSRNQWADLDVLALKAMHREPGRRYPTVEALARDIDHYFKGQPLEARPDAFSYRVGKFVRRNRRPLAGAALAVGAIATVVIFYTAQLKRARDEALAEEARVMRIQRFTRGLFDGGEKQYAPSKDLLVIKVVDRGLAQARGFDGDPAVQSDLYATLGSIYQRLGDTKQADWLLRAALDKRRALYGWNARVVIDSQIALATLRDFQEELGEAERLARDALAAAQALRPADPLTVASALALLGRVLEDSGKYPAAEPPLREAIRLYTELAPGTAELAGSVTELANVKFYESDYDTSWTLNQQALALDRSIRGEHHPTYSSDLFNLGAIQDQRGDYGAAEKYYRQGLAITRAWFEPKHPQVASDMTMLARILSKEGRYDEARALLDQAVSIQESIHGPDHAAVASALNELGIIARNAGNYDDAERTFSRIQRIYRKQFPDGHYLQGLATSNLASVELARGNYAHAEAGFREALAIYATKLSPDHDNVGITRVRLGRTLLAERRFEEARAESLAAYDILMRKKVASSIQWLKMAREDLAAEYEALGQPAEGLRYKRELTLTQK